MDTNVGIGIIGGAGQQLELEDAETLDIRTPYGAPSVPIRVGLLSGRRVAFLPRRGIGSVLLPHLVPYRANIWALASLGVTALITTTTAGGLREAFPPGVFVVTDQTIDLTQGRELTFFDEGPAIELAAPDPFDPTLRALAAEALSAQGVRFRDYGTAVVINGPRFSTRAESARHAASGGDTVNTTLMPETTLALELGMAVVNVSFITDRDAGVGIDHADAASAAIVQQRVRQARAVLVGTITEIAKHVPAGFRHPADVPEEAIASVLARAVD